VQPGRAEVLYGVAKSVLAAATLPEIVEAVVGGIGRLAPRARAAVILREGEIWRVVGVHGDLGLAMGQEVAPSRFSQVRHVAPVRDDAHLVGFLAVDGPEEGLDDLTRELADLLARACHQVRLRQELVAAHDMALQASGAKSAFLANMSHELRTPLNAILGYVELIREEAQDIGATSLEPDLKKVHGAAEHLLRLINDVLDLAKVEAGKVVVDPTEVDLRPIVEEMEAAVLPLVTRRNNRYRWEFQQDRLVMRADPTRLRQVLYNLIGNAAKFTRDGEISLAVRERDGWVELDVADTGIGIRADKLPTLFEAFTQAHTKQSEDFGGTGLGLAISRRYCQLMGGDIGVTSVVGKGTTFTVRLPIRPGHG
jgi:signal transduction histidine kinase